MANVFSELKRRNVFRVAGVYVVVGWLLAQVATTLEETLGLPAWFDTLIVALLLIGLPIAVILAWAFELTPEGVVKTEAVAAGESITADTGRKLDVAIIVGLVLLGAMIVWQQFSAGPDVVGEELVAAQAQEVVDAATIAVLPFADLSPGGDQEYFSDGISEEILNVLVGVDGLDVTSRTSSFQFKGGDLGIPEIAKTLNVRHVVEGSVRKSGEAIRVTAQLIDASNDKHLWSDTYDRPLTTENIFAIQDDIANSIVEALSTTLGVGEFETVEVTPTTTDLTAYELYLKARPLFLARVDLDRADEFVERAITQDPQFAEAWEMRSALQVLAREYGYFKIPIDAAERRALEFADRALAIDPGSATALAVIAKTEGEQVAQLRGQANIADIFTDFDRALKFQPKNASALNWRGLRYQAVGYLARSLQDFATCMKFEPYYRPCVENHYAVLGAMGRDNESMEAYRQSLNRGTAKVEFAYLPTLARLGEELAFKLVTNIPSLLQDWRQHDELWDAYNNPEQDHYTLIESIRSHLANRRSGYADTFGYIAHPIGSGWRIPDNLVMWDPMMRQYRQTADFKAYIRRIGALDYWRQEGFPPQCRPIGDNDFECD